jgi:hypothetical protein
MRFMTLSVIFLNILGCSGSEAEIPKRNHFKENGNYIEFKLGKENFKIDKRYFRGGGKSHLGVLQYAEFWALLPELETYDKNTNQYEFVDQLGWGRKIYFRMYASSVSRNSIENIIEHNRNENGGFAFSGRLDEPDGNNYGLEVYFSSNHQSDIYLSRSNGVVNTYISCTSKAMNVPSPSCRMMWDPYDSVFSDATFSKDYLGHWKVILSKIQNIYSGKNIQGE